MEANGEMPRNVHGDYLFENWRYFIDLQIPGECHLHFGVSEYIYTYIYII